ncbi:MAG: hypothetical protein RI984_1809, partial [Pseudomonadota bacterium]
MYSIKKNYDACTDKLDIELLLKSYLHYQLEVYRLFAEDIYKIIWNKDE